MKGGWILFFVCLTVYNSNFRLISAGDCIPAHLVPFAILNHGTVFVDDYGPFPKSDYWFHAVRNGRVASIYPIVLPVVVTPLFAPAAVYVALAKPPRWRFRTLCDLMEKLSASLIASLSVILVLSGLRQLTSPRKAMLVSIAFAFGTETWSISSQGLWQHGLAEVLLAAGLLLLLRPGIRFSGVALGGVCGLLAFNRPPDVLLAAALAAAYLSRNRERLGGFLIGSTAAALPFAVYDLIAYGNLAGGYGAYGSAYGALQNPLPSILTGVAALLVSPGKGLIVYSPFLLLALAAPVRRMRAAGIPMLSLWAAVGAHLLIYAIVGWVGGASYGPRLLTGDLPFLALAAGAAADRIKTLAGWSAFFLSVVFSIGTQAVGAFCFPGGGSIALSEHELWQPKGAQFYREARAGFAEPVFLKKFLGLK